MDEISSNRTVVQLDLVKSSESTSVIEEELGTDGTELFRKHIKEFVSKAFISITNGSKYDEFQSLGGDGYRIVFQKVDNAYQFVENFCKSVEEYNSQPNVKKRIFRIGAATGNVKYDPSESGLDKITGHYVLVTLSRLVTSEPGWFYVDKATFDLLNKDVRQNFIEALVKGKEHEEDIKAWRCQTSTQIDYLSSDRTIDYTRLRNLLADRKWEEADYETYLVMLKAVGRKEGDWIRDEELLNFPCTDLHTIDSLWVKYSNKHFGFSVQKEIYLEFGGIADGKYYEEAWENFGYSVGWKVNQTWISYSKFTFDTKAPRGHLPTPTFKFTQKIPIKKKPRTYTIFSSPFQSFDHDSLQQTERQCLVLQLVQQRKEANTVHALFSRIETCKLPVDRKLLRSLKNSSI